ncbi:MAG: HAD family hydrolase [Ancrocorticia sp.]|uniref:HAD family hydrolase n=1 Tax=Ancrocorticia sp. TaxID=2593684 RepID=UPI003F8E28EF
MSLKPTDPALYVKNADPRLIVADMDGTLLDDSGEVPEELWELLDVMKARGIAFAPASGRQYFRLEHMFHDASDGMPFICENGAFVVRDGVEVSSCSLPREAVVRSVHAVRNSTSDAAVVIAGKKMGYFDRTEPQFGAEVHKYYRRSALVEEILDYDDDVNKVAIYTFGDARAGLYHDLEGQLDGCSVVVSAPHWVDVMHPEANKGTAVRALQRELGVTREQTVGFGDYFNDAEMLEASGMSFAMANAAEGLAQGARFIAPSNSEQGVITVLRNLLGL